jgi:hypothetical protein
LREVAAVLHFKDYPNEFRDYSNENDGASSASAALAVT